MNVYDHIQSNKRKTVILIVLFALVIVGLGWTLGAYYREPELGILAAGIVTFVMVMLGYFKGDSVALTSAGAKKVEKKDAPELYRIVENLCITAGLKTVPKIYIIDDSSPNAFATGRSPETASVAVTTGLLQILDKQELEGVLAHEISHIKNYDIRVMTIVIVLVGTILLLSDVMRHVSFFGRRRNSNNGSGQLALIFLIIGIILAILSPLIAELIKLAVSRSREYLADADAALLTRHPDGLAGALRKIAKIDQPLKRANHATAHLFIANPFDPHVTKKFELLFSTHPPIMERIHRIESMMT